MLQEENVLVLPGDTEGTTSKRSGIGWSGREETGCPVVNDTRAAIAAIDRDEQSTIEGAAESATKSIASATGSRRAARSANTS